MLKKCQICFQVLNCRPPVKSFGLHLTFDSSKLASLKCEQEFLPQSPKLDAGPNFPQDNSEPLQSVGWKHNIGGKKMGETCSKLGTGTPPPNKFYFIQLRVSKGLFPGNMIIWAN